MWQRAADADADLNLDYDTLNPHFEYIDEDNNQRHVVWFLDAVTLLDELRAARAAGAADICAVAAGRGRQLALEYLGPAEQPGFAARAGHRCSRATTSTREGDGEIIRVPGLPQDRETDACEVDTDEPDPRKKLIIDEHMDVYPQHLHRRSSTATIPTKWRCRSMTGPIRNGRRGSSTF